ncbi:EIF3K [Cordylochernes scorpioides]|uniref:Eukaryotic translation initiation factor 3 subunit K n=1 Tax=Cordylochernes scorpioides TaxID=51811 RepID=A0ABY6K653_9ARAC|nr:EIF3K [Cordylochernes scorpioides]
MSDIMPESNTSESLRATVSSMLRGIDRYNPENLVTLEKYLEVQTEENTYDLEANLAILKLYQFNPSYNKVSVVEKVLLKALANMPHTDMVLCKCLMDMSLFDHSSIKAILHLHDLLETCSFPDFWVSPSSLALLVPVMLDYCCSLRDEDFLAQIPAIKEVAEFEESIRKYVCHVINNTYQNVDRKFLCQQLGLRGPEERCLQYYMAEYGWKLSSDDYVFIANQEESIKTKNITEKIDFENVAPILASWR